MTQTETVTQTVVLDLETSCQKNAKVQVAIDEFQAMCQYLGNLMPSIPDHERSPQNPTLYRLVTREFPEDDRQVGSKVALATTHHVAAAYQSWQSRGKRGERPSFENGGFFQLDNQQLEIVENNRGYGLKANFIPYDPEWFHINPTPYQREYLERICSGGGTYGTAEFRLDDSLYCHLPVRWDVDVHDPENVSTTVGVDLGEPVLYAAAVVTPSGIDQVEMKSGREFRHYRNRLDEKRARLSEKGNLRGVRQCRGERRKYTEQVLDTASREIVDLAVAYRPSVIALEDLTHYRETATDPIHDWPFGDLQEKIMYKAMAEGIPVETVDPKYTSITCRKCEQTNPEYRNGTEFKCTRCGYEVHADLNAAINIAELRSTL